jgi:hypothetical protein
MGGAPVEFELNEHKVEQMAPTVNEHVAGECAKIVEEGLSCAEFLAEISVDGTGQMENGV